MGRPASHTKKRQTHPRRPVNEETSCLLSLSLISENSSSLSAKIFLISSSRSFVSGAEEVGNGIDYLKLLLISTGKFQFRGTYRHRYFFEKRRKWPGVRGHKF